MGATLPVDLRNRQVKDYVCEHYCIEPVDIERAKTASQKAGLKNIEVPKNVGRLLALFSKLHAPKKILEVGTLAGYSTLWLLQGLQYGGHIITLELDPEHARIARENFTFAGAEEKIEVRVGPASHSLEQMIESGEGPFDLIFLDADKEGYPGYLELLIELSRPGTVILSDNLIPKRGEVGAPAPSDIEALAIYEYNQKIAHHPRLDTTLIPTIVGERGRVDALGVSIIQPKGTQC